MCWARLVSLACRLKAQGAPTTPVGGASRRSPPAGGWKGDRQPVQARDGYRRGQKIEPRHGLKWYNFRLMKSPSSRVPSPNLTAMSLAGQIGCVVPAIILAAVLGGLWLDRQLGTGRWFTLGLLLVSLPLSIFVTFRLAMRTVQEVNRMLQGAGADRPAGRQDKDTGHEQ